MSMTDNKISNAPTNDSKNRMVIERTLNEVIRETTTQYLTNIKNNNTMLPAITIEQELLTLVNNQIALENMLIPVQPLKNANGDPIKDRNGNNKTIPLRSKWHNLERLLPQQLADIVLCFHHIVRVEIGRAHV